MKGKKIKVLKLILFVVLILLFIFIGIISQKLFILSNISKKVSYLENNKSNIYVKETLKCDNVNVSKSERFIKEDVDKLIVEYIQNKSKITQITYPTERKLYTEIQDSKVMNVYQEKSAIRGSNVELKSGEASYTVIANIVDQIELKDKITTKIKTINIDDKEYYEISNLKLVSYDNSKELSVIVEKETGLLVKMIDKRLTENGREQERITTFEYKFDVVTDTDLEEPDEMQYQKQ